LPGVLEEREREREPDFEFNLTFRVNFDPLDDLLFGNLDTTTLDCDLLLVLRRLLCDRDVEDRAILLFTVSFGSQFFLNSVNDFYFLIC